MFLSFDVTDRISHISWQGADGVCHYRCLEKVKATEILLPTIDEIVESSGEALTRVGVVKGPGAFTGIRVGLATAQALKAALGIEVLGFTRFELLDEAVGDGLIVMPSGRNAAYTHLYRDGACVGEPGLHELDDLADRDDLVSLSPIEGLDTRVIQTQMTKTCVARLAGGARQSEHDLEPLYLRQADAIAGTSLLAKLLSGG